MCLVIQDLWTSDLHEHPPCESQRTVVSSERLLCGRFWRGCLRRGQLCTHAARQAVSGALPGGNVAFAALSRYSSCCTSGSHQSWALWPVAWLEQQLRKLSVAGGHHHRGARPHHAGPGLRLLTLADGKAAAGFCDTHCAVLIGWNGERGNKEWPSVSHFEVKREPFCSL